MKISIHIEDATPEVLALLGQIGEVTKSAISVKPAEEVAETKPEKSKKAVGKPAKAETEEAGGDTEPAVPPVDKKLTSKITLEELTAMVGDLKEKAAENDTEEELRAEIKSLFKQYGIKSLSALEKENFLPFYEALTNIEL